MLLLGRAGSDGVKSCAESEEEAGGGTVATFVIFEP
jgi:hypothetical protein